MPTYGRISEFKESEESWTQYVERLEQFFLANDIEDVGKQRAIFLSVCGSRTYSLLRDILQPKKPAETTLKDILEALRKHYDPKPSVIVERFKFHSRSRDESESVATFVAGLRKLSEHCEFKDVLEDMIRDRLVCGINNDKIQRRLLSEPELSYKKAVELAIALELATKNVEDLSIKDGVTCNNKVHRVQQHKSFQSDDSSKSQRDCYRCGGQHEASKCRFREIMCFNCDKKGHIAKVCRSERKQTGYRAQGNTKSDKEKSKTHLVAESDPVDEVYSMYHIQGKEAFEVEIELCGKTHTMEIDTGATKTILNEATWYGNLQHKLEPLKKTTAVLNTYTGESIPILGIAVNIPVKYGTQEHLLPALVVKSEGPNLLGRDWLKVIKFDWEKVFKVKECNPKLQQVLDTHKDVFEEGLGTLKGTKVKIYVDPQAKPRYHKARPVPYALKSTIELELDRLESEGIISPVEFSEWAAPIVPVVKPDGSVRICGDYKVTVNQVSKLDNYPIPKTEDLLATLGGSQKFTKLDMSQAYQQLLLEEESKLYTTINTHKGLYKYNRLPFGISSSPGIFQRTMENLLQGIPFVIVRVDDILVGGKDDMDHLSNLNRVLTQLATAGLRLRKNKCYFMVTEVTYCGYVINGNGIQPVQDKVKAIQNAPEPTNVSQLKSFLGMLNYYHKFLPSISTILEPLHELLRQGNQWKWEQRQQGAFEKAKDLLQSAELLVHYDPTKKLILATDACDYGVGAVLSHRMSDGTERPISYASRSLNAAERNYSTFEKEALAVIFGVKKFHQYLYGMRFTIKTDHKPLEGLFDEKKGIPQLATPRIQRWALTLAAYEYSISYKSGKTNGNADALSRLPLPDMPTTVPTPGETVLLMKHLDETPVSASQIKIGTQRDPILSQVLRCTLEGWPAVEYSEELKTYHSKKLELSVEDGCVLWGIRVIIPTKLREEVLEELHEAHPGVSRMKALARSYVWWPNLDQDIEKKVKKCEQCQVHQNAPAEAPLHPWEWPGQPWNRLHIDYAGPYKGGMFLVLIDAYSKWLEIHQMNSTTSTSTIEKLREIFATHGLPETVVSDNGTNFTSEEFEEFMRRNGIKHIKVAPYHPASNGMAERAVRIFKEGIEKMTGGSMTQKLTRFLLNYRITPHSTTGVPPAQLLMKRHLRTQLDIMRPKVAERVRAKQTAQKATHDHHTKDREIHVNDPVYAKDFRQKKTWMPGTVVKKTGPVSAHVQLESTGQVIRRHHDHLRIRTNEVQETETDIYEAVGLPEPVLPTPVETSNQPEPVKDSTVVDVTTPAMQKTRPIRTRQMPKHLNDYEL